MTADPRTTDQAIIDALRQTRGNISQAADLLGVTRQTVYTRAQASDVISAALRDVRGDQPGTSGVADIVISTRITADVARAIDQRRGTMSRSQYLRHLLQTQAAQPQAR